MPLKQIVATAKHVHDNCLNNLLKSKYSLRKMLSLKEI